MRVSKELQLGKAGEHLVCADLLKQGYEAYLSDQGLPYDVVIDIDGDLKRVQVKTSKAPKSFGKYHNNIYRFSLRRTGKSRYGKEKRMPADDADYIAFVFLDIMKVQYIATSSLKTINGTLQQCVDFRLEGRGKYVLGNHSAEISIKPYRR